MCLNYKGNSSNLKKEGSFENLNDTALVREIVKSNNTMLFAILYDRYAKIVYNKCYGFANSQSEAQDLTQDVFLMLFVKLGSFKGRSKFSTWLYSFTYNFCVNYVNRNKQRKLSDKSNSISEQESSLVAEVDDGEIYNMRSERLNKALQFISPEEKRLLLLKYQDEVSIKDLAKLFDIGESAVKMRLKRAKASLLEVYKKLE